MIWISYACRSLRRGWRISLIFFLFLTAIFSAWRAIAIHTGNAQAGMEELEQEYGCQYILQENSGKLIPREVYEKMRACPYVQDIEYHRYLHFLFPDNLSLARNSAAVPLNELLLIDGPAEFPADTALSSGVLPAGADECVAECSLLPELALGDTLTIFDDATDLEHTYRVVGLIDRPACVALLGSDRFSGAVLFTTLEGALALEAAGQNRSMVSDDLVQGLDARVILRDYHDGAAFRQYVAELQIDGRSFSALNPNESYTSALNRLTDMTKLTALLQRALMAMGMLALVLYVLIRTNLRAKEICILVSMGFAPGAFLGAAVLEYTAVTGAAALLSQLAGHVAALALGAVPESRYGWYFPALLLLCAALSAGVAVWSCAHMPMRILRRNNEHD